VVRGAPRRIARSDRRGEARRERRRESSVGMSRVDVLAAVPDVAGGRHTRQ
jgi:hypothetical protein